jgi:ribosomal protein S12 methylthiotransferase
VNRRVRRVCCHVLGCDKNLVDCESLLGSFRERGCEPTADPGEADIWVVYTCGFIAAARADSRAAVRRLARAKGPGCTLVVAGCWSQENAEAIAREFPAVDLVAGVGDFSHLVEACLAGRRGTLVPEPARAVYGGYERRSLLTPPHVAFVKLGEGCDAHCTFCRIPLIRGPQRSRPNEEIVGEVEGLVAGGVREVQLVAQNTARHGHDRGESLHGLLVRLNNIEDLRWIRLLYLYPGLLPVADILALLELKRVVPYLDLPIQHASPRLLAQMKRPGDPERTAANLLALRRQRPDLVLRSTVLLGFPGETEADLELLADFLARVEFDHLGVHRYSPEEGTAAVRLGRRVAPEEVADREALILDLQAEIAGRRQQARLGEVHQVIVDDVRSAGECRELLAALREGDQGAESTATRASLPPAGPAARERIALARSRHFAYDLDGTVALFGTGLQRGNWLRVRFVAVTPFDVWAEPLEERHHT